MTTEMQVLTGRAAVPAVPAQSSMSDDMRKAEAIAKAGDMVPRGYRGKPGAVLLAMDFGTKHDLDLLSVFQGVSIINGRPMIDADIAELFANRNGYQVELVELVEGVSATHRLLDSDGVPIPNAVLTSTMANANDGNKLWKTHTTDMLIKNSKRRLCKYWARGVPASVRGLIEDDEAPYAEDDPVVAVETSITEPDDPPIVEAEIVDEGVDMPTEAELRAALKADNITQVKALRALSKAGIDGDASSLKAVSQNPDAWAWLNQWIANGAPE